MAGTMQEQNIKQGAIMVDLQEDRLFPFKLWYNYQRISRFKGQRLWLGNRIDNLQKSHLRIFFFSYLNNCYLEK